MAKKPPVNNEGPAVMELARHEAETLATRPTDLLKRIKDLGAKQVELETKKADVEEKLKDINKEIEEVRGGPGMEGKLPQAMQEAEMKEFKLENGAVISVEETLVVPSMAKDSKLREPVIKWLEKGDNASVIKNSLIILFEKGDDRISAIEAFLEELGKTTGAIAYDKFQTVHAQTFKKLIKELLEEGKEVPMEELGIGTFLQSKVVK